MGSNSIQLITFYIKSKNRALVFTSLRFNCIDDNFYIYYILVL